MARVLPLVVALCAVGLCFAASGMRMKAFAPGDEPSRVPQNWQEVDTAVDYTATVNLTVAMKRNNIEYLEREISARSDPRNEKYAQWFTREQILELTAPAPAHLEAVLTWLKSVGVKSMMVVNNNMIQMPSLPLAVAEKIMSLTFRTYQEKVTGKTVVRAVGLARVPETVSEYIQAIVGASGFPVLHSVIRNENDADYQQINVIPSIIVDRYNVTIGAPVSPSNLKAVAEFQGQYIMQSDVCQFYSTYSLKGNCTLHKIIGQNVNEAGIESTLDVEYISATASDSPLDFYIWPGMDFCSDMTSWTTNLIGASNPGYVHSVSYGAQYKDPICDASVRQLVDQDFMTLSGRGITIVIASGDSGSGYYSRAGYNNGFLVPSWPAESPWATSVGATFFNNGDMHVESAVTQFGSGGGFSWNEVKQPTWQQDAVNEFFASYPASQLPPKNSYNPTGRATPDVSALGENYVLILQGQSFPGVGGTSCSTPVFAGMVSRLNDIRLLAGKGTLGCINPLIYQNPQAFYDVTIGSDMIGINTVGWNCRPGWDPVTGLGTPRYEVLESVVKALN